MRQLRPGSVGLRQLHAWLLRPLASVAVVFPAGRITMHGSIYNRQRVARTWQPHVVEALTADPTSVIEKEVDLTNQFLQAFFQYVALIVKLVSSTWSPLRDSARTRQPRCLRSTYPGSPRVLSCFNHVLVARLVPFSGFHSTTGRHT
jgi:hypothetical protein